MASTRRAGALQASARPYTLRECYWLMYDGLRTVRHMSAARRSGALGRDFMERIMLAVTAVNQCPACSYAHARMALAAGLSSDEIRSLLDGSLQELPPDQAVAVAFAQHYADSRARPSADAWRRVVAAYGEETAHGVLAATRMIMIGNATGIPLGSLANRLRGRPDARSSLPYELAMLVCCVLFMPVAALHAATAGLLGRPLLALGPE